MNNIFSLEQLSETGNLDSKLTFRQKKPDLMGRLMAIKSLNPNLRRDQMAKELGCSTSTLK